MIFFQQKLKIYNGGYGMELFVGCQMRVYKLKSLTAHQLEQMKQFCGQNNGIISL